MDFDRHGKEPMGICQASEAYVDLTCVHSLYMLAVMCGPVRIFALK